VRARKARISCALVGALLASIATPVHVGTIWRIVIGITAMPPARAGGGADICVRPQACVTKKILSEQHSFDTRPCYRSGYFRIIDISQTCMKALNLCVQRQTHVVFW
ncbi:MAG TPA: hypothetical protein VJ577_00205, partial [Burkholderiaceae bacterium]|nr:hypothetical protein [Burkholderiaceae bacterium]